MCEKCESCENCLYASEQGGHIFCSLLKNFACTSKSCPVAAIEREDLEIVDESYLGYCEEEV